MDLYTRRQLTLLLVAVLIAGAGLGIDRWRRTHPEEAEHLEVLDRAPTPPPAPPSRSPQPARPLAHAAPAPARPPLDLNRATQHDLEGLPGIGAGLAARIVASRAQHGIFASVDDLRRVRGIGALTLARVRPLLGTGPPP